MEPFEPPLVFTCESCPIHSFFIVLQHRLQGAPTNPTNLCMLGEKLAADLALAQLQGYGDWARVS